MKTEYEIRVLEIDKQEWIKKLESLGAVKKGEYNFRRYTYDFNPLQENKWVRLRTNGNTTTLTIKEVQNSNIDGTKELETQVSDFDMTHQILKELGYTYRNYQENSRLQYILDNVEIDIDTWPMIPTYLEIEGESEEEVYSMLNKLGISKNDSKATCLDVTIIYNEIYGIDILNIKDLRK